MIPELNEAEKRRRSDDFRKSSVDQSPDLVCKLKIWQEDERDRGRERERDRGVREYLKTFSWVFVWICESCIETDNGQTQWTESRWIEMISVYHGMLCEPLDQARVIGWSSGVHMVWQVRIVKLKTTPRVGILRKKERKKINFGFDYYFFKI